MMDDGRRAMRHPNCRRPASIRASESPAAMLQASCSTGSNFVFSLAQSSWPLSTIRHPSSLVCDGSREQVVIEWQQFVARLGPSIRVALFEILERRANLFTLAAKSFNQVVKAFALLG